MLTSKGIRQAARQAQETEWFEQGKQAERDGLEIDDWPRPTVKYSSLWYRIKHNWQEGWRAQSSGRGALSDLEKPESLNDRLFALIQAHSPESQRKLLTRLTNSNRKAAGQLLSEWKANGLIKTSGTGTKSNPIIIEGFNEHV